MELVNQDKFQYLNGDSNGSKCILLIKKLTEYIEESDRDKLISYLHSYEFSNAAKDFTYEILGFTAQYIKSLNAFHEKELLWRWKKLFFFLVIYSEPAEMLLYLIEQMELHHQTCYYYYLLLNALKLCVCRCKNPTLLADVYINIINKLLDLPMPRKNFSRTNDVETIILTYISLSNFIDNLYKNISMSQNFSLHKENIKYSILNLLLSMFGKPLCFLSFDFEFIQILIQKMYKNIFTIECDILYFFRFISKQDFCVTTYKQNRLNCKINEIMHNIDKLSLFNFYWLCFSNNLQYKIFNVYNPYYIVYNCLYLSNYCVKYVSLKNIILFKIFDLILNILNTIKNILIPCEDLELSIHRELLTNLSNIIIYNSEIEIKKKAIKTFTEYINTFEDDAKFIIISKFLSFKYPSKIKSIILGILKNMAVDIIKNSKKCLNQFKQIWFKNKLFSLFDTLFTFDDTDILEISDQLITLLNLILFLILTDEKYSGIKYFFEKTDYKFLKLITCSVNVQKKEWSTKLENLEKQNNLISFNKQNDNIHFYNQVINTLLIVENIVKHINEIIGNNFY